MKSRNPLLSGYKKFTDLLDKADKKSKLAQIVASATGLGIAAVLGAITLYDSFFPRYERPNYACYPGMYTYSLARKYVEREEFMYSVGDVKLKGYYYEASSPKGLVVVVHGLHAGADDYLPVIVYFVQHGYSVFAYDGRGTYDSEGSSTVGMCQSLVDLDCTLGYIEGKKKFQNLPLFLWGHSCGGYAVTSVLALHKNVVACAAVAPVNNAYTLILEKGYQYAGSLAADGLPKTFLDAYQKELFGKYADCSGVDGINSTDIPVFIAHGTEDNVISFSAQSVIAHREEITNPNVKYYITDGILGGHDSIWHSERATKYKKQIEEQLSQLKSDKAEQDKLEEFYKSVDNELYSEVNDELMDNIIKMFNKAANNLG